MTYIVSGGALNSTHSLIPSLSVIFCNTVPLLLLILFSCNKSVNKIVCLQKTEKNRQKTAQWMNEQMQCD